MNKIKSWIKRMVLRERSSSREYIAYLRKKGVAIGNRVTIFDPTTTFIDTQYPFAITIGDDVQITRGVTILTHGYDWSVLKRKYNHLLGSSGNVVIGNNVFIGMNAIILKNVKIGNNVVIGAGSVVTKNVPDDCVVAGNPARIIIGIREYYEKYKERQIIEAQNLAKAYKLRYGENPPLNLFYDYFWLWKTDENSLDNFPQKFISEMKLTGNMEETLTNMYEIKSTAPFESFEHFLTSTLGGVIKHCNSFFYCTELIDSEVVA